MGPELDKSKVESEILTGKENAIVNPNEEGNPVECMRNTEDNVFPEEAVNKNNGLAEVPAETEDVEVNIVECTKSDENVEAEGQGCEDCSESMSSFGDTVSGNENSSLQDDMEVESRFSFDGAGDPAWGFDDFGGGFPVRKKKLTDHWRRFIRPLMWRCKWVELQIKEFQSQAQKYDQQLAEYSEKKHCDFVEGLEAKSLPFSSGSQRTKVMKRKKRKRAEETTDITSYMLQHNLFSYYENKKSAAGGVFVNGNCSNLDSVVNTTNEIGFQECLSSDFKADGNIHEGYLQKIERLQSQVQKLKARIEKVESDNPEKFSAVYSFAMPESDDMLTNSDQDPESRDQTAVKSESAGVVLPESAVSSHGEVVPVSDLIENTSQPQAMEVMLEDKPMVKEETRDLKNYESLQEPVEKLTSADELPTETLAAARVNFGGKTLPKNRCYVRTRRKTGKSGWNRKR